MCLLTLHLPRIAHASLPAVLYCGSCCLMFLKHMLPAPVDIEAIDPVVID